MPSVVDVLITHEWWRYDPRADWYAQPYHWINLVEGSFWLGFALLVLVRFLRHRRSPLELLYAFAFFTFGLSDYREACAVESWLILFKGANLAALLWLRWLATKRWYPGSRTY